MRGGRDGYGVGGSRPFVMPIDAYIPGSPGDHRHIVDDGDAANIVRLVVIDPASIEIERNDALKDNLSVQENFILKRHLQCFRYDY